MDSHTISKGLEVWTLQSSLNMSIGLGFVVMALVIAQAYYRSLRKQLTLRVSVELWDIFTVIAPDIVLAVVVLTGFLMLNPDIMADIKIALPFIPVATLLFAAALVIRLFHNGHSVDSSNFKYSLWLIFFANLLNIIGYSLVMEAPSGEYLALHPSPFWSWVKTTLKSNSNLEFSQTLFFICFPVLMGIFLWAFIAGLHHLKQSDSTASIDNDSE
jgi:hypothetical protein